MIDYPDWLPERLYGSTDAWEVVGYLQQSLMGLLHPMQLKYALMEWSKLVGVEITSEMVTALGVRRGE